VLTLQSGDLGRIDSTGASTLRRNVDLSVYVGWAEGVLTFDETPLQDAIARLGRWYDLDIQLTDTALARRRFTATFHDEPVSQVLRTLEIALDVRARQTGRLVTLSPSSSPQ
jgi:ferric-dicitrate binding protein FerR (iron transport regulator)